MKKIRVFICIDHGMIWEAYSDKPVELIIKNVDKNWIRYLEPLVSPSNVDVEEELAKLLKDGEVEQPGLKEEQAKHSKTYKQKKK